MSTEAATRGSQKLLAQLAKKGSAATHEDIRAAVALPVASNYKLLRWLIRGIPPVYFELETRFEVKPHEIAGLVNHFAANSAIRDINILINGTPILDIAQVNVTLAHSGEV
jgi:hypothetical protein